MDTFKALWVEESGDGYTRSVVDRAMDSLPDSDVLIKVKYSSLNYKDALSASGNKGVTRDYPHTPGIDAAGVVVESKSPAFKPNEEVIVIGYDLGMNTSGGLAQYISVPAKWIVSKPEAMSLRDAMCFGTAGFTAALCVDTLLQVGIAPSQGPVLVTGASGGVGSIACWLLKNLKFEVHGLTGKLEDQDWFNAIGVETLIPRDELLGLGKRPMAKTRWAGAVDTVGGDILANVLKVIQYGGSVACCGMAGGTDLHTSVFPFILRGINLMGVDSVELPLEVKIDIWQQIARDWLFSDFADFTAHTLNEIGLEDTPQALEDILAGRHKGRYLVKLPD
ncbi:MAG: YhdH/YhfP family quinone oxidoreductase [Ketobacteraceae bacterium]|nr:YhdH/YhfP family quinone oxidoreductase [Ketobacteraceae bacterium]